MGEIIIAHTNDTLKSYINTSANDVISSDTIVFDDVVAIAETAKNISKVLSNTENVLILSLESHIAGSKPNELKAAELLYHLRATHQLTNPIVVLAMQTLSGILRQQPDLTILNAQGVYFADILSNFSFLTKINAHYKRYAVKDIKKEYLRHFQNKLNAAQVRHEQANIYGLKQLVKIHKAVTGDDISDIEFPNSEDHLDFLLADFVFGENEKKYSEVYNNDEKLDEAYLSNLEKIKDKNVYVIDDQSKIWLPFYKAQLEGANVVDFDFDFDASDFDKLNNIGKDDWFVLKDKLSEEKDWIILLDLRINPNEDNNRPLESISGILLLKRIKEHFPYIPVIITTASNKSKTLAKLASMKVDGYWVKEGIDNGWTPQESIENYFRLPELVTKATSEHFVALKKLFRVNQFLLENDNCWFSDDGWWRNGDIRKSDRAVTRTLLNNAFTLYKRHCRDFVMNFNFNITHVDEKKLSAASIINFIGTCCEAILGYNPKMSTKIEVSDFAKKSKLRVPLYPYSVIKNYRNTASHGAILDSINEDDVPKIIEVLVEFVKKPNFVKPLNYDYDTYFKAQITEDIQTDRYTKIKVFKNKTKRDDCKEGYIDLTAPVLNDDKRYSLLNKDHFIAVCETTEQIVDANDNDGRLYNLSKDFLGTYLGSENSFNCEDPATLNIICAKNIIQEVPTKYTICSEDGSSYDFNSRKEPECLFFKINQRGEIIAVQPKIENSSIFISNRAEEGQNAQNDESILRKDELEEIESHNQFFLFKNQENVNCAISLKGYNDENSCVIPTKIIDKKKLMLIFTGGEKIEFLRYISTNN